MKRRILDCVIPENAAGITIYSCGGFNTRRFSAPLCVVTKGIKADCNRLIEYTVRNVEHCAPALASRLLIVKIIILMTRTELFKSISYQLCTICVPIKETGEEFDAGFCIFSKRDGFRFDIE